MPDYLLTLTGASRAVLGFKSACIEIPVVAKHGSRILSIAERENVVIDFLKGILI